MEYDKSQGIKNLFFVEWKCIFHQSVPLLCKKEVNYIKIILMKNKINLLIIHNIVNTVWTNKTNFT